MPFLTINGGEKIIVDEKNRTILSCYRTTTGGVLAVFVDSYTFSNAVMGGTFTIPNETQRIFLKMNDIF